VDLNDTPEQAAYREKTRTWLEANRDQAPPRSGSSEDKAYIDSRRAWQRKLAEAGLAGVTWPKELGGQGLGPIEQVTVNQELSRAGVPGIAVPTRALSRVRRSAASTGLSSSA